MADNIDSGPLTSAPDMTVDELFAARQAQQAAAAKQAASPTVPVSPTGEPSTFSKVVSSPWVQLGLPLAAGIAGSFGRYGQGIGGSIRHGIQGGLQTAEGLSNLALQQQKQSEADTARQQRLPPLVRF